MNVYMQLQDIYNAIGYYKIYFDKIEQGLGGVASDLDVAKVCEAIQVPRMIISKEEIIMSHVSQWPMRGPERRSLQLENNER